MIFTEPGSAVAFLLVILVRDIPLGVMTGVFIDDAQAMADIAHFQSGCWNFLRNQNLLAASVRRGGTGETNFLGHSGCELHRLFGHGL